MAPSPVTRCVGTLTASLASGYPMPTEVQNACVGGTHVKIAAFGGETCARGDARSSTLFLGAGSSRKDCGLKETDEADIGPPVLGGRACLARRPRTAAVAFQNEPANAGTAAPRTGTAADGRRESRVVVRARALRGRCRLPPVASVARMSLAELLGRRSLTSTLSGCSGPCQGNRFARRFPGLGGDEAAIIRPGIRSEDEALESLRGVDLDNIQRRPAGDLDHAPSARRSSREARSPPPAEDQDRGWLNRRHRRQ